MQKTKTLILLSLLMLTLIMTLTFSTPTLAKEDHEKKVEVKVISIEVVNGKIYVTIGIFKDGILIKTITFDPPGGSPGLPGGGDDSGGDQ